VNEEKKPNNPALTLVVMAAGIGSRYGGLKQLDPIGPGGEIILDYSVFDAIRAGFGRVVFIIRKEIEAAFRERVGRTVEQAVDTAYAFQRLDDLPAGFAPPAGRTKPWGTGQATLSCRGLVTGPCAVINADDFYGRAAFRTIAGYLAGARDRDGLYDYCMVGYRLANTLSAHGHVARGVCRVDADGLLVDIVETTKIQRFGDAIRCERGEGVWEDLPGASVVSLNLWGFTPSIFDELGGRFPAFLEAHGKDPKAEYFLPTVVGELVHENRELLGGWQGCE